VTIALIGEARGENEDRLNGIPFVGASGVELLTMMNEAGLIRLSQADYSAIEDFWRKGRDPLNIALVWAAHPEFFCANTFDLRPNSKNDVLALCGLKRETGSTLPPLKMGKYLWPKYEPELARLKRQLEDVKPTLAIALGNTPSWALFAQTSITKIRGTVFHSTLVPGLKVLPTFHPAAVLREYKYRAVTVIDLAKAKRESAFSEVRRPRREIFIPETIEDIEVFTSKYLDRAEYIAVDIETAAQQITCIGFSAQIDRALVIPFLDSRKPGQSYWPDLATEIKAWKHVKDICALPAKKVFQNGLYDLHFLYRGYGIRPTNCEHDSMLLHHALQPESPKGLGFLGSVYTDEPAWKLMRDRKTNKRDE
jgi:uracil-DNA glycosylase